MQIVSDESIYCGGCRYVQKQICFREYMNNKKFKYFFEPPADRYFTIRDTEHVEFFNGVLYAKSRVIWTGCSDYSIIIKEIHYDEGLHVGDTLNIKVLSLKNTLTYLASGLGQSYKLKVVKSD